MQVNPIQGRTTDAEDRPAERALSAWGWEPDPTPLDLEQTLDREAVTGDFDQSSPTPLGIRSAGNFAVVGLKLRGARLPSRSA